MDIDLLEANFYCFKLLTYIRHTLSQNQSTVYSFRQQFHFRMEGYIFSVNILLLTYDFLICKDFGCRVVCIIVVIVGTYLALLVLLKTSTNSNSF